MAQTPEHKRLTTGQKVGFTCMLVFACLTVGLGFIQMRTNIYGPFIDPVAKQAAAVNQAQLVFDEAVKLQRIDTDQDGLNDFEELNFYQTSAYLPDTDSDGISDKKELDDGTDPLCPEGQDCGLGGAVVEFETMNDEDEVLETPLLDNFFGGENPLGQDGQNIAAVGAFLQDPAQLRAAILAAGQLTAEELAGFSDDQLLDFAQKAVTSQGSAGAVMAEQSNASSNVTAADLETLLEQPEQLRAVLLSTGKMSQQQLDQIDDETLISVTKELIEASQ